MKRIVLLVCILMLLSGCAKSDGTEVADTNGDGYVDFVGQDTDGDGNIDIAAADTDGDGYADTYAADTDGDGNFDTYGFDYDEDGEIDEYDRRIREANPAVYPPEDVAAPLFPERTPVECRPPLESEWTPAFYIGVDPAGFHIVERGGMRMHLSADAVRAPEKS